MQEHQGAQLEAQVDMGPHSGVRGVEAKLAGLAHRDLAEPIDVRGKIASSQSMLAALDEERVMAVLVPIIAVMLVALLSPAAGDELSGGVAADGVMPTRRIFHNGAEDPAHVGVEAMPLRQLESVLALQRVGRVVALERILGVVEQHSDRKSVV